MVCVAAKVGAVELLQAEYTKLATAFSAKKSSTRVPMPAKPGPPSHHSTELPEACPSLHVAELQRANAALHTTLAAERQQHVDTVKSMSDLYELTTQALQRSRRDYNDLQQR